jgi:hypothetical protein
LGTDFFIPLLDIFNPILNESPIFTLHFRNWSNAGNIRLWTTKKSRAFKTKAEKSQRRKSRTMLYAPTCVMPFYKSLKRETKTFRDYGINEHVDLNSQVPWQIQTTCICPSRHRYPARVLTLRDNADIYHQGSLHYPHMIGSSARACTSIGDKPDLNDFTLFVSEASLHAIL